jgi:Nuclease-related domain
VLRQIGDRVRERQLGSDARAGRRVRDEVRRIQWDFARRNARVLATGGALAGLATAAAAWLAPNDFWSGCAVGAGTVFTIGGLTVTVMMLTGSASLAMGAEGEVWTSSQLRPLRKLGWKLLDHVYYRYGDVDHVLVEPAGVVVVESKWSAEAWPVDKPNARLIEAIQQVRRNSRDLRLTVPDLRHRCGAVRSVLFLWGGTRYGGEPAWPLRINEVEVVVGTTARRHGGMSCAHPRPCSARAR